MRSLQLSQQVLLGKGLLEHGRLHGSPCALVEVKDFLGSYTRCSVKNCLGVLHAAFFNLLHRYSTIANVIWYHTSLAIT